MIININKNTYTLGGNTAAHEYGHIWGLADRYIDGGVFYPTTSEKDYTRTTIPITFPVGNIDTEYDYLNN